MSVVTFRIVLADAWTKVAVAMILLFGLSQGIAQLGVFTGGVNVYNMWITADSYFHGFGNSTLGATILAVFWFADKYDRWKFWIPLQVSGIVGWEIFELIVTWYRWLPPEILSTTVENSVHDIFISGIPFIFLVNFVYERFTEKYGQKTLEQYENEMNKKDERN